MKTIIISAFPGCGKSTYYNDNSIYIKNEDTINKSLSTIQFGDKILDSDSSDFSWIKDEFGNNTKERNPDFPNNYIQHIKSNIGKQDIIFVSSHKEVRDALKYNDIDYVIVYPSIKMKSEMLKRYKKRGNEASFIEFIDSNYTKFIEEIELDEFPIHCKLNSDTFPYDGINNDFMNKLFFIL